MSQIKAAKAFAKMLTYTLGVDPYEFGLVPDEEGYVKIKEFLKAVTEEEGWRHIREGHIKEVCLTVTPCPVEVSEKKIRAVDRSRLALPRYEAEIPGELYAAIRSRAWPRVHARGIAPTDESLIRLATDKAFAKRLGKRIDPSPVILTVHVPMAEDDGIVFQKAANHLYLAHELPAKALSGPGLPKADEPKKQAAKKKPKPQVQPAPGSVFLDTDDLPANPHKQKNGKKDKESWKENKKRFRREKGRFGDEG
ncbi:RNA 2'-phosphotransferase [Desulfoluna spongiiphila]|uniref:RNA 2'-phosphotransferase n=1 Tax=Desulfoluna spongiiphila TaxID=419481 RepID=UPI001257BE59|nr:RNA 2'-phosphotransferase [Desulfoluna spongiiphila]VVS91181.1 phosphotransferase kpta/tpt1 [Desulfoluna spongiiphila]